MGEYITDVIDNGIGKFLLFAHHKDPRGEREADRCCSFCIIKGLKEPQQMIMHRQYMMYACLKCCSSIILCDAVVVLCCNCDVMVQSTLRVPVVEAQRGFAFVRRCWTP